jgi:hypothetical protein
MCEEEEMQRSSVKWEGMIRREKKEEESERGCREREGRVQSEVCGNSYSHDIKETCRGEEK